MGTALTFATGSSDRVAIGNGPSLNPGTIFAWVYPTATTTSRGIYASRANSTSALSVIQLLMNGTGGSAGNVRLLVDRATTDSNYITSDTPLGTTNRWVCLMATYDSTASPTGKIYWGTMSSVMAESTYGTSTAGSGALAAEDSQTATWGNRYSSSYAQGFPGRIGVGILFNRVLTLNEGRSLQFYPRILSGCVGFHLLGRNGTGTQPDLSGNAWNGTVTGATASNGPPLSWPFLRYGGQPSETYVAPQGHPAIRRFGSFRNIRPWPNVRVW